MWKFGIVCLLVAYVNAGYRDVINYKKCTEVRGWHGVTVFCPGDYAPIGLCTSGKHPQCSSAYTKLKCCALITEEEGTHISKQQTQTGRYGASLACSPSAMLNAVCTSGATGDCGHRKWTGIACWKDARVKVSSTCRWILGDFGRLTSCSRHEVIAGVCSSGKNSDCRKHGYKIHCCELE